jgi:hypothetical protein
VAELEVKPEALPNGNKRIDFETGQLTGRSGKKYQTESSLSVERFTQFQVFEKELAYGLSLKGLAEKLQKLMNLVDKMKFAQAAILISDLQRGVSKLYERQPVIMKIAALYINSEDEDRGVFNQDIIDAKLRDWADYDIRDFFAVATRSVSGLIEIYESVSLNILETLPADLRD